MLVKSPFTFFKKLNISHLCFLAACLLLALSVVIVQIPNSKQQEQRTHLAVRSIGDELLKSNDDFRTPVPPVQQIDLETYGLTFDQPIEIDPDKLVGLSLKFLHAKIAGKSIVNVYEVDAEEMVYGFEIDHLEEKNIPCLGRILPASHYRIEFSFFDDTGIQVLYANIPGISAASASLFFVCLGFLFWQKKGSLSHNEQIIQWNGIALDTTYNQVTQGVHEISLTEKETQILAILFKYGGNLVSREHFIEEIWLKEGVVTERSLDMYISRLRKKTAPLADIQIVNQHGKGYYLKGK
ncbi:MAG: winged helix-turn-helix domain-containing protein [Bacteroidota bacterium]